MNAYHTFHIPVMGLAFTIDSPLKVGRFGITSVVSIVEDNLIEEVRKFYHGVEGSPVVPISKKEPDFRARRIQDYLDLLDRMLKAQVDQMKAAPLFAGTDTAKYFELLPEQSPLKARYNQFLYLPEGSEKTSIENELKAAIKPGKIEVNIMTKIDKNNYTPNGEILPPEFSDASCALRGFVKSTLRSAVVFSAGMNPRLYSYAESLPEFFPDETGLAKKSIILKVSDFRSAMIQGKFLAKKGLWISEFRIESGLNCGGHAFATDGFLLGPILEEFKNKREELRKELFEIVSKAHAQKGIHSFSVPPEIRVTVQGGIGTYEEDQFLLSYYGVESTGWGSPFLLVPEATNVDESTLQELSNASPEDFYLSNASPLGVKFYNFRRSSGNKDRLEKIDKERPGSACFNKNLTFNTEFTERPICTASREYQFLKLKEVQVTENLSEAEVAERVENITEKECLCQGLSTSFFLKNQVPEPHNLVSVTLCPGPNLAFFSKVSTLEEMVGHIYGRTNLLNDITRPHLFINELHLYLNYLKSEVEASERLVSAKQSTYFKTFRDNLLEGIRYYKIISPKMTLEKPEAHQAFEIALAEVETALTQLNLPGETLTVSV
ncbi:MAG: hypothetical protein SFU91_14325 [Chloroherpetonaceae bacterium]|nr:hypothetical protein [Chloroherpetonaceae bacterium]